MPVRPGRHRCRRWIAHIRISWISGCFKCRIDRESRTDTASPVPGGPDLSSVDDDRSCRSPPPGRGRSARLEYTYRDRMLLVTRGSPLARRRDPHAQRGQLRPALPARDRRSGWCSPSPARARSTPRSRWTRCSTARATTGTSGSTACPRSSATAIGSTGPRATGIATTPRSSCTTLTPAPCPAAGPGGPATDCRAAA